MNLLVAGLDRVDAGKTTFATGLVARTGAVGFKPRAGNDYWFSHDDCRTVLDDGRLHGKDAGRLADASPGELEPEALNPVHRLWRPSPGPGSGLLGQTDREFVVDRAGDRFVVNGTVPVPETVRRALPLDDALVVDSLPGLNEAMREAHLPALAALSRDIERTDRAVVESYADVARPIREPAPDAVAVVEPRRVRCFDGRRYAKACEVAPGSRSDGLLEQRTDAVVDLLEPAATFSLDPLPADVRADPDAVADAHGDAYDRLLDLAAGE